MNLLTLSSHQHFRSAKRLFCLPHRGHLLCHGEQLRSNPSACHPTGWMASVTARNLCVHSSNTAPPSIPITLQPAIASSGIERNNMGTCMLMKLNWRGMDEMTLTTNKNYSILNVSSLTSVQIYFHCAPRDDLSWFLSLSKKRQHLFGNDNSPLGLCTYTIHKADTICLVDCSCMFTMLIVSVTNWVGWEVKELHSKGRL